MQLAAGARPAGHAPRVATAQHNTGLICSAFDAYGNRRQILRLSESWYPHRPGPICLEQRSAKLHLV